MRQQKLKETKAPNKLNAPRVDTMREGSKKQINDALECLSDSIDANSIKYKSEVLSVEIEDEIFNLTGKNSKDKVYREKTKKIINRLKGNKNLIVRTALKTGFIAVKDFVKLNDKDLEDDKLFTVSIDIGINNNVELKKSTKPPKLKPVIVQNNIDLTASNEEINEYFTEKKEENMDSYKAEDNENSNNLNEQNADVVENTNPSSDINNNFNNMQIHSNYGDGDEMTLSHQNFNDEGGLILNTNPSIKSPTNENSNYHYENNRNEFYEHEQVKEDKESVREEVSNVQAEIIKSPKNKNNKFTNDKNNFGRSIAFENPNNANKNKNIVNQTFDLNSNNYNHDMSMSSFNEANNSVIYNSVSQPNYVANSTSNKSPVLLELQELMKKKIGRNMNLPKQQKTSNLTKNTEVKELSQSNNNLTTVCKVPESSSVFDAEINTNNKINSLTMKSKQPVNKKPIQAEINLTDSAFEPKQINESILKNTKAPKVEAAEKTHLVNISLFDNENTISNNVQKEPININDVEVIQPKIENELFESAQSSFIPKNTLTAKVKNINESVNFSNTVILEDNYSSKNVISTNSNNNKEYSEMLMELKHLNNKLLSQEHELITEKKKNEIYEKEIVKLRSTVKDYKAKLNNTNEETFQLEISQWQAKVNSKVQEYNNLQCEYNNLNKKFSYFESQINELIQENLMLKSKNKEERIEREKAEREREWERERDRIDTIQRNTVGNTIIEDNIKVKLEKDIYNYEHNNSNNNIIEEAKELNNNVNNSGYAFGNENYEDKAYLRENINLNTNVHNFINNNDMNNNNFTNGNPNIIEEVGSDNYLNMNGNTYDELKDLHNDRLTEHTYYPNNNYNDRGNVEENFNSNESNVNNDLKEMNADSGSTNNINSMYYLN